MAPDIPSYSYHPSVSVNSNDGFYQPGNCYDLRRKYELAAKYTELSRDNYKVTATEVGSAIGVSYLYAQKVMKVVDQGDKLIDRRY
jgi:hypothetical protein